MKRILALLLMASMLLLLCACGSTTTAETENAEKAEKTENSAVIATEQQPDETEESIAFSELTVVDNEECTIKITGIEPDNIWGYTLNLYAENKSAEKTYMVSVENASVNGVVNDPFFATEVAAGKKANGDISFPDLEENGITDYTDIEMTFRVYDSNDWSTDPVALETVHVYPYGEEKATTFVRETQASDQIILDDGNVTVTVLGYEEDGLFGYTVKLFLQNKTDTEVMFSMDEASVNGYMADPYYASSVPAGKCAFSDVSWMDSILEENGITSVEEIEFLLSVRSSDTWDEIASQTVTLNP